MRAGPGVGSRGGVLPGVGSFPGGVLPGWGPSRVGSFWGGVLPGWGHSGLPGMEGSKTSARESPRGLGPSDEPIKKHYAHIKEEFIYF